VLKIINEIKKASGNDKIDIMRAHPEIKNILEYAYNPFKKYHISAPYIDGINSEPVNNIPFSVLDDLYKKSISGKMALELVSDTISILDVESAHIFKSIINKDLRCGINIKSVNKAFPDLIPLVWDGSIKPPFALCKTFDPKKQKYPCLVAFKKDGVRAQFIDHLVTRQGHKLIGHTHIEDELDSNVDGELCVPGRIFDEASGLIRSDDPTPNSVFFVFDAPSVVGNKLERYLWLTKNLKQTDSIKLIHHCEIENEEKLMKFYKSALQQGEEGIVIYDIESLYEDGRIWDRLVPIKSVDCCVIDFYEGKGKNAGSLGGIIIDYNGCIVKVGTGFNEKDPDEKFATLKNKNIERYSITEFSPAWHKNRQFIWDNKDIFLGVIAKVEYKEKTKSRSLRQPRFKDWRWDK